MSEESTSTRSGAIVDPARLRFSKEAALDDLCPGDVLLYHGCNAFARAVQYFDNSPVFHAALLLDDRMVAESVMARGLSLTTLPQSFEHRGWALVRRFRPEGDPLRTEELAPVMDAASRLVGEAPRYAYEQLASLAFLLLTRKLPSTAAAVRPVVSLLELTASMAREVAGRFRRRKHAPLVCSGFVACCFEEAAAAAPGSRVGALRFAPGSRHTVDPESLLSLAIAAAAEGPEPDERAFRVLRSEWNTPSLETVEGLLSEYMDELQGIRPSTILRAPRGIDGHELLEAVRGFGYALEEVEGEDDRRGLSDVVHRVAAFADRLVTPGDLARSSSLHDSGVLRLLEEERRTRAVHRSGDTAAQEALRRGWRRLGPEEVWDSSRGVANESLQRNAVTSHFVSRHVDVSCPHQVSICTPRFPVAVRLTVERSPFSAPDEQLVVNAAMPVHVHLSAPGFDILGGAVRQTDIRSGLDSTPVVFDLRPREQGVARLQFDFTQGTAHLGTTDMTVEVVAEFKKTAFEETSPTRIRINQAEPIDLLLYIRIEPVNGGSALTYTLIRPDGTYREFPHVPLRGGVAGQLERIYAGLNGLAAGLDPTASKVLGRKLALPAADVDRRLRSVGENLWRELFPRDFQTYYQAHRNEWRDRTLLIVSDEPCIPWELVWPYDAATGTRDEHPWCMTFRMTRWLRRDAITGDSADAPVPFVTVRRMAVIAPPDANLHAAQEEQAFMHGLMQKHGIEDATPATATWSAVMTLLADRDQACDWLHVAAHGTFSASSPDADSALWLEGRQALTPQHIAGGAEIQIRARQPGFVFNACEVGRQGWGLTQIGGWANRMVSSGAGFFVAPLWEVDDASALKFSMTLYERLFAGTTFADAVRDARCATRRDGDPTWLAYAVFAHPNGRFKLSGGPRLEPPQDNERTR